MFDPSNVEGHALTLEIDETTEKVLLASWKYNGEQGTGDPDADLSEQYLRDRPYLRLTHKQARMLHTHLGLLVRVEKVPDAEEGTSEWFFGRLSEHGTAVGLLIQLRDWAPSFDIFAAAGS